MTGIMARRRSTFSAAALLTGLGVVLIGGLSSTGAFAQQKIKFSFASLGTMSAPIMQAFVPLIRDLEATGKVEVTHYGGGSAYSNPLKYPELLEQGVIDMAYGAHQFNAGQFPLNLLLIEPFMIGDPIKASSTFMKLVHAVPELKAEYGRMHILNVNVTPTEVIHSRMPLHKADDFKGKRVLATQPGIIDTLRFLGASVVVQPPGVQYEVLQKGVVDATSSSHQSVAAFKLNEVAKYNLEWNIGNQVAFVAMNKEKYDSLPPDVKAILDRFSTPAASEAVTRSWIAADEIGVKLVKDTGGEVYTMPPDERAALRQRLQPVIENRLAEAQKKNPNARRIYDIMVKALAEAK